MYVANTFSQVAIVFCLWDFCLLGVNFNVAKFTNLLFMICAIRNLLKKSFPLLRSWRFSFLFSFRIFIVLLFLPIWLLLGCSNTIDLYTAILYPKTLLNYVTVTILSVKFSRIFYVEKLVCKH